MLGSDILEKKDICEMNMSELADSCATSSNISAVKYNKPGPSGLEYDILVYCSSAHVRVEVDSLAMMAQVIEVSGRDDTTELDSAGTRKPTASKIGDIVAKSDFGIPYS
jgi:hypothetical protein